MNRLITNSRLRLMLALTAITFAPGCFLVAVGAAGAAGAGTVAYVRGELDATLGSPFASVVEATSRAVNKLQFTTVRETKDALTYELVTRTADDKKVDILVTNKAENLTRVRIRIGLFGSEDESRIILV